jgi:hypothetical protein
VGPSKVVVLQVESALISPKRSLTKEEPGRGTAFLWWTDAVDETAGVLKVSPELRTAREVWLKAGFIASSAAEASDEAEPVAAGEQHLLCCYRRGTRAAGRVHRQRVFRRRTLLREVESLLESHKRANVGLWLQPRLRLPRGVLVQDDTQGLIGPQMEGCGADRMAS